MTGITPKQQECLDAIEAYIEAWGHSPSYKQIAEIIGARSKSQVHGLVKKLAERGKLSFLPRRSRSIALIVDGGTN